MTVRNYDTQKGTTSFLINVMNVAYTMYIYAPLYLLISKLLRLVEYHNDKVGEIYSAAVHHRFVVYILLVICFNKNINQLSVFIRY